MAVIWVIKTNCAVLEEGFKEIFMCSFLDFKTVVQKELWFIKCFFSIFALVFFFISNYITTVKLT